MTDTELPPKSNKPLRTADVPEDGYNHADRFGARWRHLSRAAIGDDYLIGVVVEELDPGRQTWPAHWHTREEEHVLVLSGELTVRIGKERHVMRAGDYVAFPANVPEEHCLFNHGTEPVRYVLIGNRDGADVCIYPDSNKINVAALGEIYDRGARKAYFDGEE